MTGIMGSGRGVFLTGATGFLGAHVLRELLEGSDTFVTCLVRGESEVGAERALARQLGWYFPELDPSRYQARLKVVAGDLEQPRLGLESGCYERLVTTHELVLNAGAYVHHVGAASRAFRVNTDGVAALIEFRPRG